MTTEDCVKVLAISSSGDPYTAIFYLEDNEIAAFCSCPAGENRRLCRHVIRIMNGDDSILYDSSQKEGLMTVAHHLQKTTVPFLLSELNESETRLQEAEKNAKRAKKALEKAVLRR